MKVQTQVKAGGRELNHNQTIVRTPFGWSNHNQTLVRGSRIVTNHKQTMVRRLILALTLLCCATQAMADPCENLHNSFLKVHANGYEFFIATGGLTLSNQNGIYTFESWTNANPPEKIQGKCQNRHITFTRTLQGNIAQNYDGWIFEKNTTMMAGTFSHNSQIMKYGWCAEMTPVIK